MHLEIKNKQTKLNKTKTESNIDVYMICLFELPAVGWHSRINAHLTAIQPWRNATLWCHRAAGTQAVVRDRTASREGAAPPRELAQVVKHLDCSPVPQIVL